MKTMKAMTNNVDKRSLGGIEGRYDFIDIRKSVVAIEEAGGFFNLPRTTLAKLARLQAFRQTLLGDVAGPMSVYIDLAEAEKRERQVIDMESEENNTIYVDRTTGLTVKSVDETELGIEVPGSAYGSQIGKLFFQNGDPQSKGVNGWTNEALISVITDRIGRLNVGDYACHENNMAMASLVEALEWLNMRSDGRARLKG